VSALMAQGAGGGESQILRAKRNEWERRWECFGSGELDSWLAGGVEAGIGLLEQASRSMPFWLFEMELRSIRVMSECLALEKTNEGLSLNPSKANIKNYKYTTQYITTDTKPTFSETQNPKPKPLSILIPARHFGHKYDEKPS
jgi:hypothetical protein